MTSVQYYQLVNLVKYHNYRYFVLNDAQISDQEFDRLMEELEQAEKELGYALPDSPTQRLTDDVINGRAVARRFSCLSMMKKYETSDICKWMKAVARDVFKGRCSNVGSVQFVCEWKYDGVTASLVYSYGHLTEATFGHGAECKGTDFLGHAKHICNIPQYVEQWKDKDRVEVRGEIVCSKKNLQYIQGKAKNCLEAAKNVLANGTVSVADCQKLQFVAFRLMGLLGGAQCLLRKRLSGLGFFVAESPVAPEAEGHLWGYYAGRKLELCERSVEQYAAAGKDQKDEYPYPTDGIVFKLDVYTEYAFVKDTQSKHKFNIALKYMSADLQAQTIYRGYEVTKGATGKETIVAYYDEVTINNKQFSHSAIGADLFKDLCLEPGDLIRVSIHGGAGGALIDGRLGSSINSSIHSSINSSNDEVTAPYSACETSPVSENPEEVEAFAQSSFENLAQLCEDALDASTGSATDEDDSATDKEPSFMKKAICGALSVVGIVVVGIAAVGLACFGIPVTSGSLLD